MSNAQTWPEDSMTADDRRALRAEDRQAPTRAAFVSSLKDAKTRHVQTLRQAQRAKNPLHLTDAGVTWLLVYPGALIGLAAIVLFGWTIAHW